MGVSHGRHSLVIRAPSKHLLGIYCVPRNGGPEAEWNTVLATNSLMGGETVTSMRKEYSVVTLLGTAAGRVIRESVILSC